MASAPEATVAELERKLDQASANLATVKRTASLVGGLILGGGVLWLAWQLFASYRKQETPPDGT